MAHAPDVLESAGAVRTAFTPPVPRAHRADPLRIAMLINLAPRKTGSFEAWLMAMATAARQRDHSLDIFGYEPVHPAVAAHFQETGAGWATVQELTRHPASAIRKLAREYDVIHINLFAPRSLPALIAYAAVPTRVLFVNHTSVMDHETAVSLPRRPLERATMVRVSGVAGVSNFARDLMQARFHLNASRIRTIYNGVDVDAFHPPAEGGHGLADVQVLTAAHLIPEKGVEYLLRAVAQLAGARVRLVIVGDGPDEPRLQALARELGIAERTRFLGLRNDVATLLRSADVFVHPALWQEAFGNTVVEAMATACPVVASRVGGIPELIDDEQSGILVSPGDVDAIAGALHRLIAQPQLRQRLGANARARVLAHFDLRHCVEQHLDWCEEYGGRQRRRVSAGGVSVTPGRQR